MFHGSEPIYPPSLEQREREQAAKFSIVANAQAGGDLTRLEFEALQSICDSGQFTEGRAHEGVHHALSIRGLIFQVPSIRADARPAWRATSAAHDLVNRDRARRTMIDYVTRCQQNVRACGSRHKAFADVMDRLDAALSILEDAAPDHAAYGREAAE